MDGAWKEAEDIARSLVQRPSNAHKDVWFATAFTRDDGGRLVDGAELLGRVKTALDERQFNLVHVCAQRRHEVVDGSDKLTDELDFGEVG